MYTKSDFGKPKPKGKSNGSPPQQSSMANARFINIALSKEQSAALKEESFTGDRAFELVSDLMDDDYKVTFSFDAYHDCYSASLVPVGSDHPHTGYILSGKGSTALKALKQLLYIHYTICDAKWPMDTIRPRLEIDD